MAGAVGLGKDESGEYLWRTTQAAWLGWQAARTQSAANMQPVARQKLEQMGATVHGVLVKNEAGAWAAVSDAGRVMWLDGFEGQASRTHEAEKEHAYSPDPDPTFQYRCGHEFPLQMDEEIPRKCPLCKSR